MLWYGIVEFNVPLDTVQVISETDKQLNFYFQFRLYQTYSQSYAISWSDYNLSDLFLKVSAEMTYSGKTIPEIFNSYRKAISPKIVVAS